MSALDVTEIAREVLLNEAETIHSLVDRIVPTFADAHRLIIDATDHGRLVCSGMGKAGIIATKASATFASIGCSSFFLHPADALHGDLGRLRRADCALLFSYSGETEEVCKLLPELRRLRASIISITSSPETTLGKHSDVCLSLGHIEEVGPLGVAPTSSTTAMLAVADALAMSFLKEKQVSLEDFARFHPGGSLGRKLMKVRDIMRRDEKFCRCSQEKTVRSVLQAISQAPGRPGAAAIVDSEGNLCGVFTDGDLRRLLASDEEFLGKPVAIVMGKNPRVVGEDALVAEALGLFSQHEVDQLIVVDHSGAAVGMLDVQDVIAARGV